MNRERLSNFRELPVGVMPAPIVIEMNVRDGKGGKKPGRMFGTRAYAIDGTIKDFAYVGANNLDLGSSHDRLTIIQGIAKHKFTSGFDLAVGLAINTDKSNVDSGVITVKNDEKQCGIYVDVHSYNAYLDQHAIMSLGMEAEVRFKKKKNTTTGSQELTDLENAAECYLPDPIYFV